MISNFFPPENPAVYDIELKKIYSTPGQATGNDATNAHCMLDK
jgi:hypothetical protein